MTPRSRNSLGAVLIALIAFALGYFLSADSSPTDLHSSRDESANGSEAEPTIWTCSMHPQIQSTTSGDCPICGMDLIPLETGQQDTPAGTLTLSENARVLAEIETSPVRRDYATAEVRLVGNLDPDETRLKSLTARFPARIDELYINFTGIPVKKGEHLASVYSPELVTASRELLSAYQSNPDGPITKIAREKLRLWGLLPEQIEEILASGQPSDRFVLKSPIGGTVLSKNVREGDYVKTGDALFKIADLSELWLTLNAFESDLAKLRYGQKVEFTVQAFPGKTFQGTIVFIEPGVDAVTRTIPVRVNVPNPDGDLKPGMLARGIVEVKLGEEGRPVGFELAGKWVSPMHPEIMKDGPGTCDVCGMDLVPAEDLGLVDSVEQGPPLLVPVSAVLRTGKRSIVYVEIPDADGPTYEGREILLGTRAGDYFLVENGLSEGERVVTNGAFKIDSALQIQAKPSMMSAADSKGGNDSEEMDREDNANSEVGPGLAPETAAALLPSYLGLQEALANDNLDEAKQALGAMMEITGHRGALAERIHTLQGATSLDEIRRPHFEVLSDAMIAALRDHRDLLPETVFEMFCPMVYEDKGAEWLQANDNLRNPYFGASMLKCGAVLEEWNPATTP